MSLKFKSTRQVFRSSAAPFRHAHHTKIVLVLIFFVYIKYSSKDRILPPKIYLIIYF